MKVRSMNLRKLGLLTVAGSALALSAMAGTNVWTPQYTDKNNGIFVSTLTTTASLSTPPLPLNFVGSRVALTVTSVSGSAETFTPWVTVGGPIGASTSVVNNHAALMAASTITSATIGSATTVTNNNPYHDVGVDISASANSLVNVRAIEIRQNQNTQYQ